MLHRSIVAAVVAAAPFAALVAQAQTATQFRDIPAGHWAKRPAGILADRGVMPGRTPIDFAGDSPMTRYELAHTLSELFTAGGPPSTFIVLTDMPPGHTATLEVQRVLGFDLMGMRKPGYFQGDLPATRKEIVEALDVLFRKNGISPPARRANPVIFTDVKPNSELGQTLDRIVNRFGLIDAKPFTPFQPYSAASRYAMLSMLVRAMAYLNPAIAAQLKEPAPTPPPASHEPGHEGEQTPHPAVSLAPGETPPPATPVVIVPAPNTRVLRTSGWAEGGVIAAFSESLPTESGAAPAGEQRQYSGTMLPRGNVGGQYWGPQVGALLQASLNYLPLTVSNTNIDLLDTFFQGAGLYKVAGGPGWETALGAGGLIRSTFNVTNALQGRYYMTSDMVVAGVGPAATLGFRASPELTLQGTALFYPIMVQSYTLTTGARTLMRMGGNLDLRAEYALTPAVFFSGTLHSFLSGDFSGGFQSYVGGSAGFGMRF